MSYNQDNIFAKILRGEIPCVKVFEDEHTLAFMDIMPQAEGHTLVIPKEAAETIHELSPDAAANLIKRVQIVADAVKRALNAAGITLFQLNGEAAGQTVPHIHFHVLPGSILGARTHASGMADPSDLEIVAKKIRAELAVET